MLDLLSAKHCRVCHVEYQPTGRAQKYCPTCGVMVKKETRKRSLLRHQIKKGVKVGVGSGGNQGWGKDHATFKNGSGIFRRIKLDSMTSYRCERCGADLNSLVGSRKTGDDARWCVHHIDRDKKNNELSNLQLLCKSCHATLHEFSKNFHKV